MAPDKKKTSHEVLAEKRLEIEQAVPPYKPHEVEEGAVLSGQTYEKDKDPYPPPTFEMWKTGYEDAAPQDRPKATISAIPRTASGDFEMHISPPVVSRKVLYKGKSEEEIRKIYDAWIKHEWPKQVEKHFEDQAETPDPSKLLS